MNVSGVHFAFEPMPMAVLAGPVAGVLLLAESVGYVLRHRRGRRLGMHMLFGALMLLASGCLWWFLLRLHAAAAAVVIALLVMLWSWRAWAGRKATVSARLRRMLLLLRSLAILLALLYVLRPVVSYKSRYRQKGQLLVLADTSRSMGIKDAQWNSHRGISRAEALRRAERDLAGRWRQLKQRFDVRYFHFDLKIRPADSVAGEPEGLYTAIGDAIQRSLEQLAAENPNAGAHPVGVMLFTDGNNNLSSLVSPLEQAERLASNRIAIWPVGVGSERPTAETTSLTWSSMQVSPQVRAFTQTSVAGQLELLGLAGVQVQVVLDVDGETIATKLLAPEKNVDSMIVRFAPTLAKPGLHKVSLRAEPLGALAAGKKLLAQRSAFVQVLAGQTRVLYIETSWRHEFAYLLRALRGLQQLKIDAVLLNRPAVAVGPELAGLPAEQQAWAGYHVVILGNVGAKALTGLQLRYLADAVRQGTGLLLMGGRDSFGNAGLQLTSLAELSPVRLDQSVGQIDRPVKVIPTAIGLRSPIMRLADTLEQNKAVWARMPPLAGASILGPPKPAAEVLARCQRGFPMLVAGQYGAGRVMAMAFDTSWQWALQPDERLRRYHSKFWRQLVLWLANRKGAIWVGTDRPRYELPLLAEGLQTVRITAGVQDVYGRPVAEMKYRLTITGPQANTQKLRLSPLPDGTLEGFFRPEKRGRYTVRFTAAPPDAAPLEPAECSFVVESYDRELQQKLANFELLRQMAKRTHQCRGAFVPLERVNELFDYLLGRDFTRYIVRWSRVEPLGRFRVWVLAAFVGLLAAEWALRKRKGLV